MRTTSNVRGRTFVKAVLVLGSALWLAPGCDGSSDARRDAGEDAGADAGRDAGLDAGQDADVDAGQDAGADADAAPWMGVLQFHVVHNLDDQGCLQRDDCNLSIEEEDRIEAWLDEIAAVSNLAVLHWDRTVPWLVFDPLPPDGVSRVTFYDERLDPALRAWVDAFADHFASMPRRYLAVTPLNGERNGLSPCRVDTDNDEIAVAGACPAVAPGTRVAFDYDPGTGPVTASFDLERAYTNFVLYLVDKLDPDYLALAIEANMYRVNCPGQWDGLVALYHALVDRLRGAVAPRVRLFATLTFKDLLAYETEQCHGPLAFEPCEGAPSPPDYPVPDPATCYPLDLQAVHDLDAGGRLDILALSFYPDALLMATGDETVLRVYPADWDGSAGCIMRAQATPFLDPFAALDRFGWDKPVAVAELGAFSCRTLAFVRDGQDVFLMQPPGDTASQAFWLDHALTTARQRGFLFHVQVFQRDYPPIGPWTVQLGALPELVYNVFNSFACMGLYDAEGGPKDRVTSTWLEHLRSGL